MQSQREIGNLLERERERERERKSAGAGHRTPRGTGAVWRRNFRERERGGAALERK
jgi:hypothetical protein